jgi:hypothetical protein
MQSAEGESSHSPLRDGAANAGTAWMPGAKHLFWAIQVLEDFFSTLVSQEKSE